MRICRNEAQQLRSILTVGKRVSGLTPGHFTLPMEINLTQLETLPFNALLTSYTVMNNSASLAVSNSLRFTGCKYMNYVNHLV